VGATAARDDYFARILPRVPDDLTITAPPALFPEDEPGDDEQPVEVAKEPPSAEPPIARVPAQSAPAETPQSSAST
jgi:hypothetical protein